jgi:Helix-turn-helix domain
VVRFFYRMVLEVYQVFWAGMAAGEFINTRRGRNLKGRCLTLTQREEIALGRARGESIRAIAASIGRSPSTVSRELRRNADGLGRYRPRRRMPWPITGRRGSACRTGPAAVCAWSALRRSRVARRPLERVVGHLLPARLDTGEV